MKLIGTIVVALSLLAKASIAQEISGSIIIEKRLTRPSVTASVSLYQRGASIPLGKDAKTDADPIAYEQSRVVVYLEGSDTGEGDQGTATSSPTVEIKQINRQFVPDLVVVPVGSSVSFPNMDPIFHDVYSLAKAKSFDLGAYDKGETRRVKFAKPGTVEVYCHLHPNMAATIMVMPNRYYARPDPNGRYRIPNVPTGHYTLVAWHKTAGFFRKAIDVEPNQTTVVDFLIPLPLNGPQDTATNHESGIGTASR